MIPTHLQTLIDRGVISVDAAGVVRLTAKSWRLITGPPILHFVGFCDDRYHNAVRVWGKPDFHHRVYDRRAVADIAPGDVAVFACPEVVREFNFDDSANM